METTDYLGFILVLKSSLLVLSMKNQGTFKGDRISVVLFIAIKQQQQQQQTKTNKQKQTNNKQTSSV